MFHVDRRPEEPECPVVAAEPRKQHDRCSVRLVPLVPLSGFAFAARTRLALPVRDQGLLNMLDACREDLDQIQQLRSHLRVRPNDFTRVLETGPWRVPRVLPTLREFVSRFLDGHPRANRHKPSGIAAKEMILRVHLVLALGHKRIDAIKSEDVQHLKRRLSTKAAKTVNNILTVLNVLLKKAVDRDVIDRMPSRCCRCRRRRCRSMTSMSTSDSSWRRARSMRLRAPGWEAGLRCGEMIALEWRDVDLGRRQICVQRSDWNGQVTTPKGGRLR